MAALFSHMNVYNTCLIILRLKGYKLWVESKYDQDGCLDPSSTFWIAEKNGYDFMAYNPVELLGLISIYEFKEPKASPEPYWWSIDGSDIYTELISNAVIGEGEEGNMNQN